MRRMGGWSGDEWIGFGDTRLAVPVAIYFEIGQRFAFDWRRPAGFLRGFAYRLEAERFFVFVFTGYLDESGTHGDSPVTVMGGMLARSDQWKHFEQLFARLQEHHHFRVFHTKKYKQGKGDFKGWTREQKSALYWDLASLTSQGLTECVAMALDNESYRKFYRGDDKPNKVRLDSCYGLCFRQCLLVFVREVIKRKHRKRWPHLYVVMEAGHPNFGDAERIFLGTEKKPNQKVRLRHIANDYQS
jgi:hypothetical protein